MTSDFLMTQATQERPLKTKAILILESEIQYEVQEFCPLSYVLLIVLVTAEQADLQVF